MLKRNFKRKISLFLSVIALIASCSPKSAVRGSSKNVGTDIRVMAYNVHHCNPPSKPGFIDIDAIAKTIKDQNPDLVALQEIDVNTRRSGKLNQAEEIAKRLDMHFFFAKAIDHDGGDYGVAILSKYPLSDMKVNRLPTEEGTKGEPRVLATAKIKLPDGKVIRFGSTHLDVQKSPLSRELQIKEITRISAEEKLPFIIAGDFNAEAGSSAIDLLDQHFTRTCQVCDFTIPVIHPDRAIDFIAFAPKSAFNVKSTQVIPERYASDHLPVVSVMRLN